MGLAVIIASATGWFATVSQAADLLKIGLLQEPKTLNIWLASDKWSRAVLSQIYQPLFIRKPETSELVPWLAAEDPVFNEQELSYTVKIRSAKWSDGSELTSEDVAFTGHLVQEFRVPRYGSKWKFVKKIETPDKRTVKFYLKKPHAIFLTRTLTTPIIQKAEWSKVMEDAKAKEKPLNALLNHEIKNPVGSGPFALKEWKKGAYLFVKKNPHFFGTGREIEGRKLGPFIDGIIYKFYGTSDAGILALKKGSIDMFWWGIQAGYLEDLQKQAEIALFTNERSALYYLGFNLRRPPFDEVNLRRAVAILIDKEFIMSRILQGYGVEMSSIVPPGNNFYHCPTVTTYGEGLSQDERVRLAYTILKEAGYSWEVPPVDAQGKVIKAEGIRLPNGQTMAGFTILTPPADYDPLRAMSGMIIQEWLRAAGMPATAKPMGFSSLIDQVKKRQEFDAFILAYGRLSLDPDYLRSFFHSRNDKKRGSNTSGYRNSDFDRISDQSAETMDPLERQKLIWEMQKILADDLPWIPLYNPKLIEAARKGKFGGWVQMLEGIGNLWSFCQLRPE
jgi:ABC-type transport system substrate-binding protein